MQSITMTKDLYNPTLEAAYAPENVMFLNIAADFGTFQPLSKEVELPHFGKIPLAVYRICQLTSMCSSIHDEHPNASGYALIAREIVQAYRKLAS
jgi:lysophospholipase L1-like esterase